MLWRKNHSWQQPRRGILQNRTGMSIDNVLSPVADLVCSCPCFRVILSTKSDCWLSCSYTIVSYLYTFVICLFVFVVVILQLYPMSMTSLRKHVLTQLVQHNCPWQDSPNLCLVINSCIGDWIHLVELLHYHAASIKLQLCSLTLEEGSHGHSSLDTVWTGTPEWWPRRMIKEDDWSL